jgi:hypothetical protein
MSPQPNPFLMGMGQMLMDSGARQEEENLLGRAAAGTAEMFRELGDPLADRLADQLENDPLGTMTMVSQMGGFESLLGVMKARREAAAEEQQRRALVETLDPARSETAPAAAMGPEQVALERRRLTARLIGQGMDAKAAVSIAKTAIPDAPEDGGLQKVSEGQSLVRIGPDGKPQLVYTAPKTAAPGSGGGAGALAGLPEGINYDDIAGGHGRFVTESRDFIAVRDGYQRVRAAVETAAMLGNLPGDKRLGPSDIALIFGFMKMVDPGSTVREGEFATAENAGGVTDKVRASYNKLVEGGILTPELRASYMQQAEGILRSQYEGQKTREAQYGATAARFGIPSDLAYPDVVGPLRGQLEGRPSVQVDPATLGAQPTPAEWANAPAQPGPARPKPTPEEFEREKAALRHRLGREPTVEELRAKFGVWR